MKLWHLPLLFSVLAFSSCAVLHHAQIGEIDNRDHGEKFEVMVSETGINLKELGSVARSTAANKKGRRQTDKAFDVVGYFYMGPQTGNMVFDPNYPDAIFSAVHEKCPHGKITNLVSIRETNKYPIVSGEIVKITGRCVKS